MMDERVIQELQKINRKLSAIYILISAFMFMFFLWTTLVGWE